MHGRAWSNACYVVSLPCLMGASSPHAMKKPLKDHVKLQNSYKRMPRTADVGILVDAGQASKAPVPAQQTRSVAAAMQQDTGKNASGGKKATSSVTRHPSQAAGHSHGISERRQGSRPGSSRVVRHVPDGQQGGQASPRQHGRGPSGQHRGRSKGRAQQLPQKRRAPDSWQHGRAVPTTGHHERPKHKGAPTQLAVPQPMSMGRVSPGRPSRGRGRGRGHRGRKGASGR